MKIVHVFWGLTYGGIETMLVNIANAQIQNGAQVFVILINDLIEENLLKAFDSKINIICLKRKQKSKNIMFIIKLNKVLLQIKPNAIHIHRSELFELILNKSLKNITSLTLHALPKGIIVYPGLCYRIFPIFNIFKNLGNVTSIDKIPKVFAISQSVKNLLQNKFNVDSIVVNNGIKTSDFKTRAIKSFNQKLKIVQVSRLEHDKKGQDLLIEAAYILKGKIDITFIGEGSSIMYLKNIVKEKEIEDYVHFIGKKDQEYIAKHLCDYDLFVQPSRWEGFGLTVAEAMASQVPVLVSEGQGPAEIICGEKYGWIFKNGDSDDLINKIIYIIEHYNEALEKAIKGVQYVRDKYDVSVTARNYLNLY